MAGRGDIVLARFPYTDGTGTKLRPVLILVETPGQYRDYVVLFISSQLAQATPGVDVVLRPSEPAFRRSGLKVASVLRVAKVASISDALVVGTLGQLDHRVFEHVVRRLVTSSGQAHRRPPGPSRSGATASPAPPIRYNSVRSKSSTPGALLVPGWLDGPARPT